MASGVKVYVVEADVYEARTIMGVYSSLEAARAAHPAPGTPEGPPMRAIPGKQTNPSPYKIRDGGWQPAGEGRWVNGFDVGWHESITEYDLDG